MTRKHLRSAVPAFNVAQGEDAAVFRSALCHFLRAGCSERQFEQIVDWWNAHYAHKPPTDRDALLHHFTADFGEELASVAGEWQSLVSEHGPDIVPAEQPANEVYDSAHYDQLMRLRGE